MDLPTISRLVSHMSMHMWVQEVDERWKFDAHYYSGDFSSSRLAKWESILVGLEANL